MEAGQIVNRSVMQPKIHLEMFWVAIALPLSLSATATNSLGDFLMCLVFCKEKTKDAVITSSFREEDRNCCSSGGTTGNRLMGSSSSIRSEGLLKDTLNGEASEVSLADQRFRGGILGPRPP